MYRVRNGQYPVLLSNFRGPDAPIPSTTFTTSPDPYYWVLYYSTGTDYVLADRVAASNDWYAVGSKQPIASVSPGTSGTGTSTCQNLGLGTSSYIGWIKSNAGWHNT